MVVKLCVKTCDKRADTDLTTGAEFRIKQRQSDSSAVSVQTKQRLCSLYVLM